jgi:hypothetical protein
MRGPMKVIYSRLNHNDHLARALAGTNSVQRLQHFVWHLR